LATGLRLLLELKGYAGQVAHDGGAALETARACRPAVMLADLGLPSLDGYGLAAGFDRHLTKPVQPRALETLLARFTETKG
jgi:CheY-like chemotaxis protein